MKWTIAAILAGSALGQSWMLQDSHTNASLRGVSAVNEKTVWASGTGGMVLRTTDGGVTWRAAAVAGAEELDFRGIRAIDENTAYIVSAGEGVKSRIYKSTDGGASWNLQFTNPDAKGFFDAIAFWDANRGIVLGDPVDGQFTIFTTADGGKTWTRRKTPPACEELAQNGARRGPVSGSLDGARRTLCALKDEGAFAASNTCLMAQGKRDAWFVTGGPGAARVFHSKDGGVSWAVTTTPLRNDGPSAGIFSIAFANPKLGVAVGGEYSKDKEDLGNAAVTKDGGKHWTEPLKSRPKGFKSSVAFIPGQKTWIATGTSGSDVSSDGGQTWRHFDEGSYNAIAVSGTGVWAVGGKGRIARLF
jgi:photosystem II stability/assembly factor-like uncharacterized protein